jgi:TolA-binding protein
MALTLIAFVLPARAQLFADDDARKAILDLRARLAASDEQARARQAESNEQLQALRRSLLDLNSQLEALRAETARLRGSNEQLARDLSELQRRQRDLGQAVDDRLRKLEPLKVSVNGREISVDPQEKLLYDEAIALLRAGEFDKANQAFILFQARWPASGSPCGGPAPSERAGWVGSPGAQARHCGARPWRCASGGQTFSRITAMPWPTPMHMVHSA